MRSRAVVATLGILLGGLVAPAAAEFPADLEGELRGLLAPPLPPLAGSRLPGEGSFRLAAGPGGDLRTSPGSAELIVPGGFLRGEPASPFPVSHLDVPLGPLLGGIDWYALGFATTPGLGGYGLPLVTFNPEAALGISTIDLLVWNFLWVLSLQSGAVLPYELLGLEASSALASFGLPSGFAPRPRLDCRRTIPGGEVVILPGCRYPVGIDRFDPEAGEEEPSPENAMLSLLLSLLGLDGSEACPGSGAPVCEVRTFLASLASRPLDDDPGEPRDLRWIWQAGGAYDVVHASGSLAAYAGWRLLALGPEAFGLGGRAVAFLLVPPPGAAAPAPGAALMNGSASGLLAGGYGIEQAASPCSGVDADADGLPDPCDNCSALANGPAAPAPGEQDDADGDGYGNACDCDFDQDGSCTIGDFNVFLPQFLSGRDSGVGTDMDGDGFVTIGDFGLFLSGFVAGGPGPSGLAP